MLEEGLDSAGDGVAFHERQLGGGVRKFVGSSLSLLISFYSFF